MTTARLAVTCAHGEERVFLTTLERYDDEQLAESPSNLRWRHDEFAPWGGGHLEDGQRDWYATVAPDRARTRSHTTDDHMIFLCHLCRDRLVLGIAKWQSACELLAEQGRTSVSLSELRAITERLS